MFRSFLPECNNCGKSHGYLAHFKRSPRDDVLCKGHSKF